MLRRLLLLTLVFGLPIPAQAASLLGHSIAPGAGTEISFPIDEYFQNYATQGGNPKPSTGRMVIAVPANFDPSRNSWPILIVTSTSDNGRTSPMDVKFYQQPAIQEGWSVLATDAAIRPNHDNTEWRLALLAAALQAIHREWPRSSQWPLAFAGLSGGAKQSCALAGAMSKRGGTRIAGMFLAGMNEDRMSEAYQELQPPKSFLDIPVWLSSGSYDTVAPLARQEDVRASLNRNGFHHVRLETFSGRHEVSGSEIQRALRWFNELLRK